MRRDLLQLWAAGFSNCTVGFFNKNPQTNNIPVYLLAIMFAKHPRPVDNYLNIVLELNRIYKSYILSIRVA